MEAIFLDCGAGVPQLKRNPLGGTRMDATALDPLIERAGLGAKREPLLRLALPAVRIFTEPSTHCPLGDSRVGGAPDVPNDFQWPEFRGQPLAFIAQLNLAQFAP